MHLAAFSFLTLFISGFLTTVFAAPPVLKPAQTYEEVLNGKEVTSLTSTYRVRTARVVIADYALIRKDFPQTRGMTPEQIHEWLLNQGGYLSQGQIDQGLKKGINSPIVYDLKDKKMVLRPPQYDRGLVFKAEGGGLIDGKGFGANLPELANNKNGLLETNQGVREFFYTKAVKRMFEHADAPFNVVDSYAVIDWGFDAHKVYEGGATRSYRAGAIFRQGHVRDLTTDVTAQGQLPKAKMAEVERVLREYGMTSAETRRISDQVIETLNVQGTKDGRFIYDFGAFRVESNFHWPAFTINDYVDHYRGIQQNPDDYIVFDPKSPLFPQADDRLKFSYDTWTKSADRSEEEIRKKIIAITEKLDHGKALPQVRAELHALLRNTVNMPAERWKKIANSHTHIDGCENFLKEIFPN